MRDVGFLCANFSLPSLSVLDLSPMYATDKRQTSDKRVRCASSLNAPTLGLAHNKERLSRIM